MILIRWIRIRNTAHQNYDLCQGNVRNVFTIGRIEIGFGSGAGVLLVGSGHPAISSFITFFKNYL